MSTFLGIDLGTTHVKAALADSQGRLLRMAAVDNGPDTACEAGECYTAEGLWQRAAQAVQEACRGMEPPAGVGVTGMADSGVALDSEGLPLYPIAPWSNPCGEEYGPVLEKRFPDLTSRTGQRYHPKFALSRILWLRDHQPQAFRRMARWLSVTDYLLFRLTGEAATDQTFACRTLLYRLRERCWDEELCAYAGVTGRLPRVLALGGGAAGRVTEPAAGALGLPAGIPVVSAGHDHLCALYALESAGLGSALNSLGTAEVFVGVSDAPADPEQCRRLGVNQGCFAGDRWYWMANLPASGGSVEWLRRMFSVGGPVGYELFDRSDGLADAGGVLYLPYLNGSGTPDPDPARRGAFLGLSSRTTPQQLIAAVNQGIGFETRRILDSLSSVLGLSVSQVTAVGGGARNRALVQAKADASGREYQVCSQSELTVLSAAWQAARAAGESMALPLAAGERFSPYPDRRSAMEHTYRQYRALCAAIYRKD